MRWDSQYNLNNSIFNHKLTAKGYNNILNNSKFCKWHAKIHGTFKETSIARLF